MEMFQQGQNFCPMKRNTKQAIFAFAFEHMSKLLEAE